MDVFVYLRLYRYRTPLLDKIKCQLNLASFGLTSSRTLQLCWYVYRPIVGRAYPCVDAKHACSLCSIQGLCRALYAQPTLRFANSTRKEFVTDDVVACVKQALNVVQNKFMNDKSRAELDTMVQAVTPEYLNS